ncbi:ABC transporter permease [Streptacidiphilus anmyonensis]|uniref:ABC transporter permease n=1 Tax=Streptacidiphilus anmyonensis TaxID=405782 RepID=UPI0005AA4FD8|nr:ABC transporter permease [Streptacidiphilus anmyonensis]
MTAAVDLPTPTLSGRPPARSGGARAMVLRNVMIYRHTWPLLAAEVFEPVLYLVSFGIGIGALVGHVPGTAGTGEGAVRYPQFVAPALLATAAMNGAMNETTFNMFGKLRTDRTYESILTTPMTVWDVALGETCWALLRGALVTAGFLLVVLALGLVGSAWALLVLPSALLIGFAFASLGLLVVTLLRNWQDFQLIQLVMLPMFLFATTFYPLGVYPRPVQLLVECLPLYQSIELLRQPFLGQVGPALLVPAAYLLVFGTASLAVALRRLETTLRG